MKQVANLWLSQSSASGGDGGSQRQVQFSSAGSLTSESWSDRAQRAANGDLYEGTNAQ